MNNRFLLPCLCGGKPWFNIRKVICLKCGDKTHPLANWETSAKMWNEKMKKTTTLRLKK